MSNVINMQAKVRLIKDAREAREKRDAERAQNDRWADKHKPTGGGIDDLAIS